jgi:hypothetical protein
MATPSRRAILRWLHEVEDAERADVLMSGWPFIQGAMNDGLIGPQDADGFADVVLRMADDDLVDFDYVPRHVDQFGANPSADLQQVSNLRSTAKGRHWLAESPRPTISVANSTVGQIASGDIANVSLVTLLEHAERAVDGVDADEADREEARGLIRRLRDGAGEVSTAGAAGVAAQAISRALGIG